MAAASSRASPRRRRGRRCQRRSQRKEKKRKKKLLPPHPSRTDLGCALRIPQMTPPPAVRHQRDQQSPLRCGGPLGTASATKAPRRSSQRVLRRHQHHGAVRGHAQRRPRRPRKRTKPTQRLRQCRRPRQSRPPRGAALRPRGSPPPPSLR